MSQQIPNKWPDMEAWFITTVKAALVAASETGIDVVNMKKPATGAYKQVLVVADYGPLVTQVSRYVRLRVQTWCVRADNKTADLPEAYRVANLVNFMVESAATNGNPILAAGVDAGPSRTVDSESSTEYHASTLLLQIRRSK